MMETPREVKSGVKCTGIGRHCLVNISCVDKECVCPQGQQGNGLFECADSEKLLCTVSADPHLNSYGKARVNIDLPCRYRLTRYVTGHRTASNPHAFCSVEVYAVNELNMGHYYVRSLHVSVGVTDHGRQIHDQFDIKKFGVTDDKIYKFLANVTKVRTLWGFGQHELLNGVDVFPTYDNDNNFAVLSVPECDTRIKYRAYDRSVRRQRLLPGISIVAPADAVFYPNYGMYPHALCGTGEDGHSLYSERAHYLGLKNANLAIIYDILLDDAPQHGNPRRAECEAAIDAFHASNFQVADIDTCGPILTSPECRKCTVDAVIQPIEAFTACLTYRRTNSAPSCAILTTAIAACGPKWTGPLVVC